MTEMEQADWASRWSEGRIGFHQSSVSNFLDKYAERAWGGEPGGRFLVPLCGKSLDMVFLADRDAEAVVGVEYVEQAVEEFFAERGLEPEVESGPPLRYEAGPYTLFASDFFAIGTGDVGRIDKAFDRAALIALDPETRVRYAEQMGALLPAGAVTLLITFDYDQSQMSGPPFAVAPAEVEEIFAAGFEVERLETREVEENHFRSVGVTEMRESAFKLTRRGA